MAKKAKVLPKVTRSEFASQAMDMSAAIGAHPLVIKAKEFSTGSLGWHGGEKMAIQLPNGTTCDCIVNVLVTVIGSKDLPNE